MGKGIAIPKPVATAQNKSVLRAGMKVPDFSLRRSLRDKLSRDHLLGHNSILIFYLADWNLVCSDELEIFSELVPAFQEFNARVYGISVDNVWSQVEFRKQRAIHFDLLSDFYPHGEVSKKFGVFQEKEGVCERALFVLDANAVIRWNYIAPHDSNPGTEGVLHALQEITSLAGQKAA